MELTHIRRNKMTFWTAFAWASLTIFVTVPVLATPALRATCDSNFRPWIQENGQDTKINGVLVTGNEDYPFEMVMAALNLVESPIDPRSEIISVGEGFSHLVPTLAARNFNITGVDIWYGIDPSLLPANITGDDMREYLSLYSPLLLQGSALQLPFQDNSVDVYLSHLLVNNLSGTDTRRALLREAFRVTRSGGEIRIYGFARGDFQNMRVVLLENGVDPLNVNFGAILDGSPTVPERIRGWVGGRFFMQIRVP